MEAFFFKLRCLRLTRLLKNHIISVLVNRNTRIIVTEPFPSKPVFQVTINEKERMKNVFHILVCFCNWSVLAQPVSDDLMNLRIESLEKAIHKNPLNDSLIWERIELSSLGFPDFDVVLNFEFTEVKRQTVLELKKRFSSDFERIERKHIAKKKFNLVEEGDFYLNRIWYNFNCLEFDKAIADAIHLRDSASYSEYDGRGEYYNEWANLSLFYLYIFKQEFTLAFQTSDVILNQLKIKNPNSITLHTTEVTKTS